MTTEKEKELEQIVEIAVEQAKKDYISQNKEELWENLSKDDRVDFARPYLEKYYDPQLKSYHLPK